MRRGYNIMNIKVCSNCDYGVAVDVNIDRPKNIVKCRLHGFRMLDDKCGKWKQIYNQPFSRVTKSFI